MLFVKKKTTLTLKIQDCINQENKEVMDLPNQRRVAWSQVWLGLLDSLTGVAHQAHFWMTL